MKNASQHIPFVSLSFFWKRKKKKKLNKIVNKRIQCFKVWGKKIARRIFAVALFIFRYTKSQDIIEI